MSHGIGDSCLFDAGRCRLFIISICLYRSWGQPRSTFVETIGKIPTGDLGLQPPHALEHWSFLLIFGYIRH
jgi:hypothetical protein